MLKFFIFFLNISLCQILFPQAKQSNIKSEIQLEHIKEIKLFHSPPDPFFIGRPFKLSLVAELNEKKVISSLLFFKTDKMKSYREILLEGDSGLYQYKININDFPGDSIEYFFAIKTTDGEIYGAPVDGNNILQPIKRAFIDPIKYYEQKKRLNK